MRLLLASALAGAALAAAPAQAQYLVSSGCDRGDWQVIEVSSGGSELLEVCTNAVGEPVVQFTICGFTLVRLCPLPVEA